MIARLEWCPGEDCGSPGKPVDDGDVYQCTNAECRVTTFVVEVDDP